MKLLNWSVKHFDLKKLDRSKVNDLLRVSDLFLALVYYMGKKESNTE